MTSLYCKYKLFFCFIFAVMAFSKVIGQTSVKQTLVELVQLNRLSHALLFLGQEGSGSLAMALAFAQYVVCEKKADPMMTDACGTSTEAQTFS